MAGSMSSPKKMLAQLANCSVTREVVHLVVGIGICGQWYPCSGHNIGSLILIIFAVKHHVTSSASPCYEFGCPPSDFGSF